MTRPSPRTARRLATIGTFAGIAFALSCAEGPFERTNPLDPHSEFDIAVILPADTLDGNDVKFRLLVSTEPAIAERFQQSARFSFSSNAVRHIARDTFVTNGGSVHHTVTVAARLGPHSADTVLVIRPR